MERRLGFVAGLSFMLILVGIAVWYLRSGTGEMPYFEASTLCQAFQDKEAEAALLNHFVGVDGKVKEVGSIGDQSFLMLDGSPHGGGVRCFFEGARAVRLLELTPGTAVMVEGTVTSASGGLVTMKGCQFVE